MDRFELAREFANPGNNYRMLPLLRVNDEVEEEQLRWQIQSLKKSGFGGIFSILECFRDGAEHPFVSDWWRDVVQKLARLCTEAGLEFWVYDDEDWPSGSIGGQLVQRDPDAQWKYLAREEHTVPAGESVVLEPGEGKLVAAVAARKTVRSIDGESLVELTAEIKDGKLSWQAPAEGEWLVTFFMARFGTGIFLDSYGDLMDKRSMGEFVDWVYDWHWKAVQDEPGAQIRGYFTDEPAFSLAMVEWQDRFHWYPAMPYTPEIGTAFKEMHGYAMEPKLPLLYHQVDPESLRFRCHYWATCCHMYSTNYFKQIYDFCEARGVKSSGHLVREEVFVSHLSQQAGNLPTHFRHMHIPGIDWIHPFETFEHLPANTPKYATSMAHLMGRDRTWCESFAAAGYGVTMQQFRRILNWEHVNGINMQIPITFVYSMRKRCNFYPGGLTYQQPWWDHVKALADYEARLCLLAAGLGHVAQIALAYPSVDITANCWNHDLLNDRGDAYNSLGDAIRRAGYDHDILDDQALVDESRVENGKLVTATESFDVLIFPRQNAVKRATIERARDFARDGGTVLFVGGLPGHSYEHGSNDPELATVLSEMLGRVSATIELTHFEHKFGKGLVMYSHSPAEAIEMLREHVTPDLILPNRERGVYGWRRRMAEGLELFQIMNYSDALRRIEVSVALTGHPEHWNPETGAIEPVQHYQTQAGRTLLTLTLQPMQLMPLVFRPERNAELVAPAAKLSSETELSGPWKFSTESTIERPNIAWNFQPKNWGFELATEGTTPPTEIELGDWSNHGLPYFSGLGIYEKAFELPAIPAGARVELDLGGVAISAEVIVNGVTAGISIFAPWKLDITAQAKQGRNELTVRVANSLANYMSQFKEMKDQPLNLGGDLPERLVSGLLGPVKVRIYTA